MKYALLLSMLMTQPLLAQDSVEQLLLDVQNSRGSVGADYRLRVADFIADADSRKAKLSQARAELLVARQRAEELSAELDEIPVTTDTQNTEMTAFLAVFREFATDAAAALKGSLTTAQFPGRAEWLMQLADENVVPAPDQLRDFHLLLLNDIAEMAKVSRFETELVDAAGYAQLSEVVRVGTFNLISGDNYLRFDSNSGTVQTLPRQPAQRFRADARNLFEAEDAIVPMAIDPTAGQLLSLLIQTPGIADRVRQGGFVAYTIIALGAVGLLISLYRLVFLATVGRGIRKQLRKPDRPEKSNALGRILAVYADNRDASTESLELRLDEAIIMETPRLERWHTALKVIAAVAPLLGLLGTVIGMIETFQQITLFGTSDPRLMADGISKALLTTMLGLMVAIPIVLLHSLVAGQSRRLIEVLEEQSAGIIAEQSENRQ